MKKILFLLLCCYYYLLSGSAWAADVFHEVGVGLNLFRSNVAPLAKADNSWSFGWGGRADYAYYIDEYMSIRTGLSINTYHGSSYVAKIVTQPATINIPEEWQWDERDTRRLFLLDSRIAGYSVQQSAVYLHVPLLFGYETAFFSSEQRRWYVNAGFKLGYSTSGRSKASIDTVKTTADFSSVSIYGIKIEDDDALKGLLYLGTFVREPENIRHVPLKLGFSSTLYIEAGMKQQLPLSSGSMYVGIFGEYSLYSALAGKEQQQIYGYEALNNRDGPYATLHYTPASHVSGTRSKVFYPMSFGITIRFGIGVQELQAATNNNRMFKVREIE